MAQETDQATRWAQINWQVSIQPPRSEGQTENPPSRQSHVARGIHNVQEPMPAAPRTAHWPRPHKMMHQRSVDTSRALVPLWQGARNPSMKSRTRESPVLQKESKPCLLKKTA